MAETATFPGIRYYPGLGVHGNGKTWAGDASFVTNYCKEFGAPRETQWFLRSPRYRFVAEKKINWNEMLVDPARAPTSHKRTRDPNWSNYMWNQRNNDILGKMLKAPIVDGEAKLAIFIALTATAERHRVPRFMINKGLTRGDTKKNRDHVGMDLADGWKYMADVRVAIVRRHEASRRLASLMLGEYYPSEVADRPRGLDSNLYRQNAKLLWHDIVAVCPRDGRGNPISLPRRAAPPSTSSPGRSGRTGCGISAARRTPGDHRGD